MDGAEDTVSAPHRLRARDPRVTAQAYIRDLRARLSQGSTLKPEFEYELLSMFARNEMSARVTLPLLAVIFSLASMLVKDGVVKTLNVEGPGKFEVSDAATMLAQAKAA